MLGESEGLLEYGEELSGTGGGREVALILVDEGEGSIEGSGVAKLPELLAIPPSKGLVPKLFARRMRVLGLFVLRD